MAPWIIGWLNSRRFAPLRKANAGVPRCARNDNQKLLAAVSLLAAVVLACYGVIACCGVIAGCGVIACCAVGACCGAGVLARSAVGRSGDQVR